MIEIILTDENADLLYEELTAQFNSVSKDGGRIIVHDIGATQQQVNTVVNGHDNTGQTTEQLEALTRAGIRQYLRKQLTSASPDTVAEIASTVQGFVGSRQGMINAIDRIAALYGYDIETNAGYLRTVYVLVGIFS